MGRIATGGRVAINTANRIRTVVSGFLRNNPTGVAALAAKLPGLAGRRLNAKAIVEYARREPLNTVMAMYAVGETYDLAMDLFEEDPSLEKLVLSTYATDTVDSLTMDRAKIEETLESNRAKAQEKILALPISALLNFADEAQVIEDVLVHFNGTSHTERFAQLMSLRRVLSMPDENFLLYEQYRNLR